MGLAASGESPYDAITFDTPAQSLWLRRTGRAFMPEGSAAEIAYLDVYPPDQAQYVGCAVGRGPAGPTLILSTGIPLTNVRPSPAPPLATDFQTGAGLFDTYLAVDLVNGEILVGIGPAGQPADAIVMQRASFTPAAFGASLAVFDMGVDGCEGSAPAAPWSRWAGVDVRAGTLADNPFDLPAALLAA